VIRSFRDRRTEAIFDRAYGPRLDQGLQRIAYRKLAILHVAKRIDELRSPPGNRLEALSADRKGQWSIRVSDQWRICFHWSDGGADAVELVDYH
jgi:proteic killer suppression protein